MIILDTTFLIDLMKGKRDLASYLNDTMEKGTVIATTVFNVYELYKNVFMREFDKIEAFLSNIKIISFSNAVIATKLCKELKSKGHMIHSIYLLRQFCFFNHKKHKRLQRYFRTKNNKPKPY